LQSQSKALTDKGVISFFAEGVSAQLVAAGMAPVGIWMLLLIVYVAMHYLFASQSAHVAAMYPPFLAGEPCWFAIGIARPSERRRMCLRRTFQTTALCAIGQAAPPST
jgi:hypothetical protein